MYGGISVVIGEYWSMAFPFIFVFASWFVVKDWRKGVS